MEQMFLCVLCLSIPWTHSFRTWSRIRRPAKHRSYSFAMMSNPWFPPLEIQSTGTMIAGAALPSNSHVGL
ncbi:hypothetical protein AFLA_005645 [Aspergillus flavus NRRL3357]|nr:hypothetical protein AFLA_005645 [Aspergillus flavus NRRL3357]